MEGMCYTKKRIKEKEDRRLSIYEKLNEKQREAVEHREGPLLILAGAGSGKTRVLTHRIAYLIETGVNPYHILAITFTNKAAKEMRERIDDLVGYGSEAIWVSTFHSACVKILRKEIHRLGYGSHFTIYDTDDQKALMKDVLKQLNLDSKIFKERKVLAEISKAKNEGIDSETFQKEADSDYGSQMVAKAYKAYEKQLKQNNALDFDDLLCKTVELLRREEEVCNYYQNKFQYILVDEYQDTNTVQFQLIHLLARKHRNLCVVGDDDQSIYKFRGANIRNILDFEHFFSDTKVIKLEQNYRSTKTILQVANGVIAHNHGRKSKTLWTEKEEGEKVALKEFETGFDEADFVVRDIQNRISEGGRKESDFAVLYRTNAQSRMLEERFVSCGVPYKVVGGVNFYSRREIKDILAYLKTIDNGRDDLAVRRIINVPRRGIGLTTINRIQDYVAEREMSFYDALLIVDMIPDMGRGRGKIESFVALIQHLKEEAKQRSISDLISYVLEKTEYIKALEEEGEEVDTRLENIEEFCNKSVLYEEECQERNELPTLSGFLEEVALVADAGNEEEKEYVTLMTIHSAKGLEFPEVYLVGMEDGLFPSYLSITEGGGEELEEERRLCYVGITRAKEKLTLTHARRRMVRGEVQFAKLSRFLHEIPKEYLGGVVGRVPSTREMAGKLPAQKSFSFQKPVREFGVGKFATPDYKEGDWVRHGKLGEGMVVSMVKGGRDYEVTVDFVSAGRKKMFAAFAQLVRVEKC